MPCDRSARSKPSLPDGYPAPLGAGSGGNSLYASFFSPTGGSGEIGKYDLSSGAYNASFLSGPAAPGSMATFGGNLYVANFNTSSVREYNASTGAIVNSALVTGLPGAGDMAIENGILSGILNLRLRSDALWRHAERGAIRRLPGAEPDLMQPAGDWVRGTLRAYRPIGPPPRSSTLSDWPLAASATNDASLLLLARQLPGHLEHFVELSVPGDLSLLVDHERIRNSPDT